MTQLVKTHLMTKMMTWAWGSLHHHPEDTPGAVSSIKYYFAFKQEQQQIEKKNLTQNRSVR